MNFEGLETQAPILWLESITGEVDETESSSQQKQQNHQIEYEITKFE